MGGRSVTTLTTLKGTLHKDFEGEGFHNIHSIRTRVLGVYSVHSKGVNELCNQIIAHRK